MWYVNLQGMFDNGDLAGPYDDKQFVELVSKETIKAKTLVNHQVRTKGQWIEAAKLPAVAKLINQKMLQKEEGKQLNKARKTELLLQKQQEKNRQNIGTKKVEDEQSSKSSHPSSTLPGGESIMQWNALKKTCCCIAGLGLLLLALSPFFRWVGVGNGGMVGIKGDGQYLLALSIIATIAFTFSLIKMKWMGAIFLAVQLIGTVVVFWMASLIWQITTFFDEMQAELVGNPFAGFLNSFSFSPGTGLYLGLVGGIVLTGACGFLAFNVLKHEGKFLLFYSLQISGIVVGILLSLFINFEMPTQDQKNLYGGTKNPMAGMDWLPGIGKEVKELTSDEKDYIDQNIKIYDIESSRTEYVIGPEDVFTKLKIQNNGDKIVIDLVATIYFIDNNGDVISEDEAQLVLSSEPLKPKYIQKGFAASYVPSEWKEGAITIKMTHIEFSD